MPKRAFGLISNNLCQDVTSLPLKRALERSPQKVNKKVRTLIQNIEEKENAITAKEKPSLNQKPKSEVSTRTIELKVQNISIQSAKATKDRRKSVKSIKELIDEDIVDDSEDIHINIDEDVEEEKKKSEKAKIDFGNPSTYYEPPKDLPSYIEDYDKTQIEDMFSEPHYAADVFKYYKETELLHRRSKYLQHQTEISKGMRSILVDWMVEVQESFELNHETLYLAVQIVDRYLSLEKISKSRFQLLGAVSILLAAKFDERIPPCLEDFLFICDDAYTRNDMIEMEIIVFKKLGFFIGFPLSYRFLRRYARCAKLSMEVLTLARYILETSLLEYDLIEELESHVAASALLLALKMKGGYPNFWTTTLEYYSGYKEKELTELMYKLNDLISMPVKSNLKTIQTKYSHKIFYGVAKLSPLPSSNTESSDIDEEKAINNINNNNKH